MVGRNGILWNDMNNKLLTPKKGFMKSSTSPPLVLSPQCCIHLWSFFFSKIDPKVANVPSLRGLQTGHWQNLGTYGKKTDFRAENLSVWCLRSDVLTLNHQLNAVESYFCREDNLNFFIIEADQRKCISWIDKRRNLKGSRRHSWYVVVTPTPKKCSQEKEFPRFGFFSRLIVAHGCANYFFICFDIVLCHFSMISSYLKGRSLEGSRSLSAIFLSFHTCIAPSTTVS